MSEISLPPLMVCSDGTRVESTTVWREKRRPELLELFRTHVYGRAPVGRPDQMRFELEKTDPRAMDGRATLKLVRIHYTGPGGNGSIGVVLFIPNERSGPAPTFVLGCNRGREHMDPTRAVRSEFWPAEMIVERGFAAAAFHFADVDPDEHDGFRNGVHGIFDRASQERPGDAWGTISAWAWGFSRVMDYLESDGDIDRTRVAIVGHSRGGKTALWAGAQDERFAMVVSNNSGCTGAAIARGKRGESIAQINGRFPHWFCTNYRNYNGRENDLPVDQHMLIALIAPRLAYVTSATEDDWADPAAEWRGALAASPAWEVFGHRGLTGQVMPPPDTPLHEGSIGYHLRTGEHSLAEYDWAQLLTFARRHL